MGNAYASIPAHSAEHFGDTRDDWWDLGHLRRHFGRWGLAGARTVLDLGCGVGHWGDVVEAALEPGAQIIGVDREEAWVEAARERSGGRPQRSFQRGHAEQLPFPAGSFDLVTCQTVLIHCPDPERVVAEMVRLTRPGGAVLVAEPNNLASTLLDPAVATATVEETLQAVELELRIELGKRSLGEGFNSLGDAVPGIFQRAGLLDVAVALNDRANPLLPPYASRASRAQVEELEEGAAQDRWGWPRAQAERYFLAGGGTAQGFEDCWAAHRARRSRALAGIRAGTYTEAGGSVHLLVVGRRPS